MRGDRQRTTNETGKRTKPVERNDEIGEGRTRGTVGRNQKLHEFEINQFKEKAKFESTEMEKLRKENEQLKKFQEDERLRRSQEVEQRSKVGCVTSPQGGTLVVRDLIDITRRMKEQLGQTLKMETAEIRTKERKCIETREIEKIEERLHDKDGVKGEHTHIEVVGDHEGELADCLVPRCEQLDSLLRERRETLFSLEADLDQVSPVELCGVEGTSAVDRCTRSLGGTEAPGTLVGTRFPSVNVPVCVCSRV